MSSTKAAMGRQISAASVHAAHPHTNDAIAVFSRSLESLAEKPLETREGLTVNASKHLGIGRSTSDIERVLPCGVPRRTPMAA